MPWPTEPERPEFAGLSPSRRRRTFPVKRSEILPKYTLKLFITGTNPRAEAAISNLRRICDQELKGQYSLEIVDVLEDPEAAEVDRVLATPTLIKRLPPPLRRVIGDMSDKDKVLLGLEVAPSTAPTRPRKK